MIIIIEEQLKNKKYIKDVVKISSSEYKFNFILRNDDRIPLKIKLNKKRFPFELPTIYIDTESQEFVPNIPHICSSGYICYLDKEGIVWSDDPEKVFDYIFEKVESVLLQMESVEGIHREFQFYYLQVPNIKLMYSYIKEGTETRRVKLCIDNKTKKRFLFDSNDVGDDIEQSKQIINAIYIPFSKPLDLYIPNKSAFWTPREISELLVRCVSDNNIKLIKSLTKENNQSYYVLDLLLADRQNVLIALMYDEKSNKNYVPILDVNDDAKILPYYINRVDDKKTLTRGGAISNGEDYKILLIGCGSVGSDIAFQLSRSGFKDLTIIDSDIYNEENIYRHFMGKSRGKKDESKSLLMKNELENRYDNLEVTAYNKDVFDLLEKMELNLKDFSLVISAMGDVNKERLLNKYILKAKVPTIYTWVEAYGIGGHAVLINKEGCYNCLFTDKLRCKVNFAGESDIAFVKNFGGCLGTFTPYGGMDSMQTAIITSRLAQDFLINNLQGNKVISWKGNADRFIQEGYNLDDSYREFDKGIGEREDIKFEGCAYCRD